MSSKTGKTSDDKVKAVQNTLRTGSTHYGVAAIIVGVCGFIWWVTGETSKPTERPKPTLSVGAVIDVPITLVAADKSDLACAASKEFGGFRCEYQSTSSKSEPQAEQSTTGIGGTRWPDVDPSNAEHRKTMLAPYMTVDNTMFLIPGLFEDSAVDERYRDEGPRRVPRDKQDRFTAQCDLTLREEVEGVMVRWTPTAKWQGPHKVWIGETSNCRVSEP